MKKIKVVLLIAITMLGVTSVQAQVKFGVKGGLNITDMSLNSDVFNAENRTGFFVGPILKINLPVTGLGVDIAGLYDQRDAKINDETVTQKSIMVPVNLRLGFGLGDVAGIYLAAGPQVGFNIGDDTFTLDDMKANREQAENTFQLRKSAFSVNLGGGVNFGHFEIGATYNIAISNTADVEGFDTVADQIYEKRKAKTNAWQINAVYYF